MAFAIDGRPGSAKGRPRPDAKRPALCSRACTRRHRPEEALRHLHRATARCRPAPRARQGAGGWRPQGLAGRPRPRETRATAACRKPTWPCAAARVRLRPPSRRKASRSGPANRSPRHADRTPARRLRLPRWKGCAGRALFPGDGQGRAADAGRLRHQAGRVIGKDALEILNLSDADKARAIAVAMERMRWLDRDPPKTRIDVNVAAGRLVYWREGKMADTRKVVVGEPENETPQLGSPIYRLVANPTWTVPRSIQSKENRGQGQRLPAPQQHGVEGRLDRPAAGPKNSLGLVKFDMKNEHQIYLHDTPAKQLFQEVQRQRSHGCVRVEDALGFAEMLAKDEGVLDEWHRARATGKETFVPLPPRDSGTPALPHRPVRRRRRAGDPFRPLWLERPRGDRARLRGRQQPSVARQRRRCRPVRIVGNPSRSRAFADHSLSEALKEPDLPAALSRGVSAALHPLHGSCSHSGGAVSRCAGGGRDISQQFRDAVVELCRLADSRRAGLYRAGAGMDARAGDPAPCRQSLACRDHGSAVRGRPRQRLPAQP
ncbi:l,D-transpeptidase catalytic domain-containing protein [Ditylenchus destructor]|nr:l,D-transpeptidase catalytic domain-containing protein [Ditylenchus destructor]